MEKLSLEQLKKAVLETSKPKPVAVWQEWFIQRGWTQAKYVAAISGKYASGGVVTETKRPRTPRAKKNGG